MKHTACGADEALVSLRARDCELVIFDLDGVLTRTAKVHAAAWKATFDAFLARRPGNVLRPFDARAEYLLHVDGKPRLDGVRHFLASRGIVLPEGAPDDGPGSDTVWGLGNGKNRVFNDLLQRDGVETYAPALELFHALGACGIGRAVVSASRNCRPILAAAGLAAAPDTVVDGDDAAREGLAGKPAPDTFLAAARRLEVAPARAAVIEDAEAGVQAARAGGFRWVIGVDRDRHGEALRAHGASVVIRHLDQIRPEPLPSALAAFDEIRACFAGPRPALFLDYDGTLTPIVSRPQDAVLSARMRSTLKAVAESCTLVLVTGRGLDVIQELVGMEHVVYAADHGFQVHTPGEHTMRPDVIKGFESLMNEVADRLRIRVGQVPGALIEAKRFSVAVHYRLVPDAQVQEVKNAVCAVLDGEPRLRLLTGKKVLELQPAVDWDKGTAVSWVIRHLHLDPAHSIYIGDDVTDESAFRLLHDKGITIAVQQSPRRTAAAYRLANVEQVRQLLHKLAGEARQDATR